MNTFDLIVLGIIAASALFAFLRGFVRESLSIVAWVGAAIAVFYLNEPLEPLFSRIITARWLSFIIEPIVIFVIALILLSLITGAVSSRVRESSFGTLDRGLGLLFGLARGFLVLSILVVLLDSYLPASARPAWITESRTLPLLEDGAAELKAAIPKDILQRGSDAAETTIDRVDRARKLHQDIEDLNKDAVEPPGMTARLPDRQAKSPTAEQPPRGGYSNDQRQSLDDTILQATEAPAAPEAAHKERRR